MVNAGSCAHLEGFWETTASYGCSDNFITCPAANVGGSAFLQNCVSGAGDCGEKFCGKFKCACLSPPENPGSVAACNLAKSNGVVHDVRTPSMIADGCKPCGVVFAGNQAGVVTLRDSKGHAVSATVTS